MQPKRGGAGVSRDRAGRSGLTDLSQRMFEKSWQIKTHGTLTRVRPSCLEARWENIVGEI
jgi:hypothetical protein